MAQSPDSMTTTAVAVPSNGHELPGWDQWMAQSLNPDFFLRLAYVCDGKFAPATVLWDLILHARRHGLDSWRSFSAADYVRTYSAHVCSRNSFDRAVVELQATGWIELDAGVRNTTRRFKFHPKNWEALSTELNALNPQLPGLVKATEVSASEVSEVTEATEEVE